MKCKRSLGFRTELLVDVVWVTCSANAFVMATHATHPTNHLQVLLKFPKNMEGKPQTNTEIHQPDLGSLRWLSMTWWCLSWPWPFNFANRFYSFWVVVIPLQLNESIRSCWFDKSHAYEACLYRQPFKYQLSMQQAKAHKNRYEQSSFSHPEVSFGISECSYSA